MSDEPMRWLEDPNIAASLRGDLAHSAAATVQGIDYTVGLAGLRGAIAAQTGSLAPAAAGSSFGLKAVVGGLLVVGGGLGLWKVLEPGDDVDMRVAATAVEIVDDADEPELPAPQVVPAATPTVVPSEPTDVKIATPEPKAEPTRSPTKRDERTERKATAHDADDASRVGPVTSDPVPDDRYLQEATMVARARKSLSHDPALTLSLIQQIASEFPSGQLVEERRALEIRALAKLGRLDEAKERAAVFLADHAKGPHAAAVRRAIAD